MKRIYALYLQELRHAFERRDRIDSDLSICHVRFLYRAHMIGQ